MPDYDVLVWQEADGWHYQVVEVRNGKDGPAVAVGTGRTEAKALAAADEWINGMAG